VQITIAPTTYDSSRVEAARRRFRLAFLLLAFIYSPLLFYWPRATGARRGETLVSVPQHAENDWEERINWKPRVAPRGLGGGSGTGTVALTHGDSSGHYGSGTVPPICGPDHMPVGMPLRYKIRAHRKHDGANASSLSAATAARSPVLAQRHRYSWRAT
jgi:hypothetical protein